MRTGEKSIMAEQTYSADNLRRIQEIISKEISKENSGNASEYRTRYRRSD